MKRYVGFGVFASVATSIAVLVACSSSSGKGSSSGSDAGEMADTVCAPIDSQCGQPCQAGNSLGVGQFCNNITDCSQTKMAHLCSSLGSTTTHFCTFRCMAPSDGGSGEGGDEAGTSGFPTDCGQGATCTCDNSGNCGCTPTACLGP